MFDDGGSSPAIIEGVGFTEIKPGDRVVAPLVPETAVKFIGQSLLMEIFIFPGPADGRFLMIDGSGSVSHCAGFFGQNQINFVLVIHRRMPRP